MLLDYLRSLCHDWIALLSGIGSILLTLWGFFAPSSNYEKNSFFMAAFLSGIIASYTVWKEERRQRLRVEQEEGPQIQIGVVTEVGHDRIRVKNVGNQPAKDVAIQQPEQEHFTADFVPSPIPFVNNGETVEINAIIAEQTTATQRISRRLGDILTSHRSTAHFSVRFENLKGTCFRQRFKVHRAIFQEDIHCYFEGPRVVERA